MLGTGVIITGTNFNALPANNTVFFGAVKATVTSGTTSSLTVTTPAGATYQPMSVLDNATGLTGYSSKPYITTFTNPFGTGIPSFYYGPKVDFPTGGLPRNVATADVDGDGKPDLIVTSGSLDNIGVLRNTTTTTGPISASSFAAKVDFAAGPSTAYVAVGDVDGDGKPDMVVVTNANISVFLNTSVSGTVSFATKVDFTSGFTGPVFGALGDIDGDGKPDIVTANPSANSVSVRLNTSTVGSVSFATKVDFASGLTSTSVAIGDLDGDGKPDLAVTNAEASTNNVSVLRNTSTAGSVSFAAKVPFATGSVPRNVAIGDVDGDGKPDLVVANNATSPASTTVSVLRNTSTSGSINVTSFAAKVDFTAGTAPRYVAMGDADGDGKPDLVVANTSSNNISVLRNTATSGTINASSFAAAVNFATVSSPISVAIVDVDGDGIPEVAAANGAAAFVSVFQINLSVVPVTLTNVKAYQKNAGVQVEWTAQQENNIDRYEVERSQNGQQFIKLGSVEAKGNSSVVINYNLFDPAPLGGVNFYRIKIIEAGKITYSQVMKVTISNGATLITIYPNPLKGKTIVLQMNNLQKGNYTITLSNGLGQQLLHKVIEHPGGSATSTIEPSKVLAAGVYLLRLSGGEINITHQVIKN